MSADAVGSHMPAVVTLDDLTAMNASDVHGHRYETSPEGALSVMPPADSDHAKIATRLMGWFIMAGWPLDQVLQVAGIRIPGRLGGVGGRIPDITVWRNPAPEGVWLPAADLLLTIEIVSPGSEAIDELTKLREYASVGIPQYWVVDRDNAQTVTMHRLTPDGAYATHAKMPLPWLLRTSPTDHVG